MNSNDLNDLIAHAAAQIKGLQEVSAVCRLEGWCFKAGVDAPDGDLPFAMHFRDQRETTTGRRSPIEHVPVDAILRLAEMLKRKEWVQP